MKELVGGDCSGVRHSIIVCLYRAIRRLPPVDELDQPGQPAYPLIAWHTLPNAGTNGHVYAMVAVGSDLYVGGFFESTGDYIKELGYIARYNIASKTWHALPNKGLDHHTQALEIVGDDLYVAGSFSATGDNSLTDLGFIARYDMTTKSWHSLPNKGVGSYSLWALERMGSDLYVGGNINQTGEGTLTDLGGIVRLSLDVQNWRYLPLVVKR